MSSRPKNVVYLILDSMRPDRMGVGSMKPSPCPFIDGLFASGLHLTHVFTAGCPTEFAYPSLATSTLPLDRGGYLKGIRTRGTTLAEAFQSAGYQTAAFFQDCIGIHGGYDRGFEDVFLLYDLVRPLSAYRHYIHYYLQLYREGGEPRRHAEQVLRMYLGIILDGFVDRYVPFMRATPRREQSLTWSGYDWERVADLADRERTLLRADPSSYLEELAAAQRRTAFHDFADMVEQRRRTGANNEVDRVFRGPLLTCMLLQSLLAIRGRVERKCAENSLQRLIRLHNRSVGFSSAGFVVDRVTAWLKQRPGTRPFFVWIHLMDVHEDNFASFDVFDGRERVEAERALVRDQNRRIWADFGAYRGNPFYDYGMRYTDSQVERLVSTLGGKEGLADTIWVLLSDHGNTWPRWPIRRNVHSTRSFFDEFYHVPVAFVGGDIQPHQDDRLLATIDVGPTLLDLAEVPVPPSFKGHSVCRVPGPNRDHILMEHLGSGPGDLLTKPALVGARSRTHKLVCQYPPLGRGGEGTVIVSHDLLTDPGEQVNLADAGATLSAEARRLREIIDARWQEIRRDAALG